MKKILSYKTPVGTFYVAKMGKLYHPVFEDESLGSYATIQQAIDDLAGGHTFSIGRGIDPTKLGIPRTLDGWQKLA